LETEQILGPSWKIERNIVLEIGDYDCSLWVSLCEC